MFSPFSTAAPIFTLKIPVIHVSCDALNRSAGFMELTLQCCISRAWYLQASIDSKQLGFEIIAGHLSINSLRTPRLWVPHANCTPRQFQDPPTVPCCETFLDLLHNPKYIVLSGVKHHKFFCWSLCEESCGRSWKGKANQQCRVALRSLNTCQTELSFSL